MNKRPDLKTIEEAHSRISPHIHKTPVLTSTKVDTFAGARLFLKCESFQKVGAFKARGACNAVLQLDDETAKKGVVTHSSGNHAAALSFAAGLRSIDAHIVMPSNSPAVKKAAVEGYGGKITFCEPTLQAREETAQQVIEKTGAVMIHPFDDYRIIAGQGTTSLELMEQVDDLDMILAPVGGGGMISGTALAAHYKNDKIKVIACEPKNADDAYRSFKEGKLIPQLKPDTIADGLRTSLSDKTFDVISNFVHDIVTVTEEEIVSAMRTVWERMKIIIEPSSAVPVAAALTGKADVSGKRVGIIITGGNVDLSSLPF